MRRITMAVILCALAFPACRGADGYLTVSARFDDIGDLAPSAPVMMADIQIGKVEEIELAGQQARVTMSVEEAARVPESVVARVRRTSLLGEKFVDFELPEGLAADAPLLRDGQEIAETETRPDLEDLVEEGNQVLSPIAASEVATLVDEGAKGFGGQGENLKTLLNNFQAITEAYAGRTDEIRGVILSLNQLNTTLAAEAGAHAQSVANSAQAIGMLRSETDRLERAIRSLNRLAVAGSSFLQEHSDEMGRFFRQMATILQVLREEEASIEGLIKWAPYHNRNLAITMLDRFVQVYQDFIFCGLNDDPSDPARRCPEGH